MDGSTSTKRRKGKTRMANETTSKLECSEREAVISPLQHAIDESLLSGPVQTFNRILFKQKMRLNV